MVTHEPVSNHAPPGFLFFSEATNRLAAGMWGGLPQPIPIRQTKQTHIKDFHIKDFEKRTKRIRKKGQHPWRRLSLGFGPWCEQARKRLTGAAIDEELLVYITAENAEPVVVPAGVLAILPKSRGGLGDIPFRVSLKTITAEISKPKSATHSSIWPIRNARESEALFRMLTTGRLVVRETDFLAWYEAEHARGQWESQRSRWESQRSRKKIHGGRPPKQTKSLENTILGLVRDEEWRADTPISTLHRILVEKGLDPPSPDTLSRLIDRLHLKTGEPGLYRSKRRSPRPQRSRKTSAL
jgi:hypothetical protein